MRKLRGAFTLILPQLSTGHVHKESFKNDVKRGKGLPKIVIKSDKRGVGGHSIQ